MILSSILLLISLAFWAVLAAGALAPIESLTWWAGWTDTETSENESAISQREEKVAAGRRENPDNSSVHERPTRYIIYLSGISTIAGRYLAYQEQRFLEKLKAEFPDAIIISDVFPYAPSGKSLMASRRLFGFFWRALLTMRMRGRGAMGVLANVRNVFQVLVSADHRYGPIFNLGASRVILKALYRCGYKPGAPITLIGFSGGAQVAIGAATFLHRDVKGPIDVISLGGVMSSDPGLSKVRTLYQFYGGRDRVHRLGALLFPERWRTFPYSTWNEANKENRIVSRQIGDMAHAGSMGYFGLQRMPNGDRYADNTLQAVTAALKGQVSSFQEVKATRAGLLEGPHSSDARSVSQ
ncbi:MAG: hypothetical protein AAF850_01390 [Pseudomonadota bacterium]